MLRVVQLRQGDGTRRVALVEEPRLRLLRTPDSLYDVAAEAIRASASLTALLASRASAEMLQYDEVYQGNGPWTLDVPLHHPDGPWRSLVSGTGLTHFGSARDRQSMHNPDGPASADPAASLTDSMRMFQWGVEHGRPADGAIGIAPEWFFKGDGSVLHAPGEPLEVPPFAEDGGEEAEAAGLYIIGPDGTPHRVGIAAGNEFSDHLFEKRNYLNLAGSKLRNCAIGPEIVIGGGFDLLTGEVRIERGPSVVWSKTVKTGESEMCHSLRNIEHHHFKFPGHRRPGDVHVHFFGAHSLSFGEGLRLQDGDVMSVRFDSLGRPLRNPIKIASPVNTPVVTIAMT